MANRKVSKLHMAIGCDLIGSQTSMVASRNLDLELTDLGVIAYSKKSNRTILVPFSNIKAMELMPEVASVVAPAKVKAPAVAKAE